MKLTQIHIYVKNIILVILIIISGVWIAESGDTLDGHIITMIVFNKYVFVLISLLILLCTIWRSRKAES